MERTRYKINIPPTGSKYIPSRLHYDDEIGVVKNQLGDKGSFKEFGQPTAILCSDFHLREDTPTCWTGDFQTEQWTAVNFIASLQRKYDCKVIHAGDLFHHWKPSPLLLSLAIRLLPNKFYTIYGQHDLPQHSWELRNKSGIATLIEADKIKLLLGGIGVNYGQEPPKEKDTIRMFSNRDILVWHHLTYLSKPFPGAEGGMAEGILRKYPQFDLIVTGDNHQSFTVEYQGRRLVNPGNLTRQVADQADFQPRVALWYAADNSIQWVNLPIQEGVISREHIEVKAERDARIDAFISRLDGDYKAEMSFEENLESFFKINDIRDSVKQIIYKAIDS